MAADFEEIAREYQDRIFRLAVAILGDREAARDAAQEALLRVWRGLPRFRNDSSLATWIYAITRNTCLSAVRCRMLPAASIEEDAPRFAMDRRAAEAWWGAKPADAAALLARLPVKYRQAVMLFYLQEKSYDEVARMLDLPVGTVKTYLFRARQMLAEGLVEQRVPKGGS